MSLPAAQHFPHLADCQRASSLRHILFSTQDKNNHAAIVENVKIQDIACGINHTIALDTEGRLFSWGFGGYGRLGHNSAVCGMV